MSDVNDDNAARNRLDLLTTALQRDRRAFDELRDQLLVIPRATAQIQEQLARAHGDLYANIQRMTSVPTAAMRNALFASPFLSSMEQMQRVLATAIPDPKMLEGFATQALVPAGEWSTVMDSYRRALEPLQASRFAFESHFVRISELSVLAHARLQSLDLARVGAAVGATVAVQASLQHVITEAASSYSSLLRSFSEAELRIGSFAPQVSGLPAVENYNSVRLGLVVTAAEFESARAEEELESEIEEETDRRLAELLNDVDPGLVKLWRGSTVALRSSNPDRVRHFATSLRELWGHTIRVIAPDEAIRGWTSEPNLYHEGRPTRQARLLYVCREINHGAFEDFLTKDVAATLEFLGLFQQGTHEVSTSFTEAQLAAMRHRMEGALRFVLEVWKKTRS